jgi:hypothetical protein
VTTNDFAIIVQGLDKTDLLDLEGKVSKENLKLLVTDDDEKRYGEPGTLIAIAVLGSVVLPPLLVWLANHRRKFVIVEQEVHELPDGTKVARTLTMKVTESGPPTPETLEKLSKFQIPLEKLNQLFGGSDGGG